MVKAIKVMLIPNNVQKTKMFQYAGASRFAYNWALAREIENYEKGGKFISDAELRKEFTKLRHSDEYAWLLSISNNVTKQVRSAYGMGKAALFMADRSYPISMTYIHCMMAVCAINRKHKQEAQEEMLRSWELAKMDGFLEPFIEHHGLLRGLIEACIRNRDPEAYQRITEGVISFSRGWMALHNPENRRKVTGELSTMEFSIAMLASGGWTNKEIGEHLGISINTVKHYLTDIFCKLNVKKRDELKKFMLK